MRTRFDRCPACGEDEEIDPAGSKPRLFMPMCGLVCGFCGHQWLRAEAQEPHQHLRPIEACEHAPEVCPDCLVERDRVQGLE